MTIPIPPLFAADVMLGKTAKWLRILGFDTFYDNRAGDPFLQDLCRNENRVLLTRDTSLQQSMTSESSYLVVENLPRQQLVEISRVFGLARFKLPSRCSMCNGELVAIEKIHIREKVPPYVFSTQSDFSCCLCCQRIYWPGTHLGKINLFIENIRKSRDLHSLK
jgi:uncharacterized protein with PIN domain